MEKMPQEEIKKMKEVQEISQALGEERVKARKYTRKAKESLAKMPEKADAPNVATIPMAEAQIKRRRAMREAAKTAKEMGEVKIVKPPKPIVEKEAPIVPPPGDAERTAKRHEEQLQILEQVAKQKAEERAREAEKYKDYNELKEIKGQIEAQKGKEEMEGNLQEAAKYEKLAEELAKPEEAPKKKTWWEKFIGFFGK